MGAPNCLNKNRSTALWYKGLRSNYSIKINHRNIR
jgi:hypothetical protein